MAVKTTCIYGQPGTGKTTYLLSELAGLLDTGVSLGHVAFLSFTRRSIQVAKERTVKQLNVPISDLNWFRTIHSVCFILSGFNSKRLMSRHQQVSLLMDTGISPGISEVKAFQLTELYLNIRMHSQLNGTSIADEVVKRQQLMMNVSFQDCLTYLKYYDKFKEDFGKVDYNDVLNSYIKDPISPFMDTVFIDEAQDLSEVQWNIIEIFTKNTNHVIFAGDPNQSIYRFAGACPQRLLDKWNDFGYTTLPQSYRLPRTVWNTAENIRSSLMDTTNGNKCKHNLKNGSVEVVQDWTMLPLTNGKDWIIQVLNKMDLRKVRHHLNSAGIAFKDQTIRESDDIKLMRRIRWYETLRSIGQLSKVRTKKLAAEIPMIDLMSYTDLPPWPEAFKDILSDTKLRQYKAILSGKCKIRIGTVHSFKGDEAENVIFIGRLSSIYLLSSRDKVAEEDLLKTLYVAVTRARDNLYIETGSKDILRILGIKEEEIAHDNP